MKKIISLLLIVVVAVSAVTANTGCFFSTDMKTQEITGVSSSYTKELNAEDFTLNAQAIGKLSFESSDEYVATVTQEGVVDVKNVGTAIIIIKAEATGMYQEAFKMVKIYVEDVNSNTIPSKDPSNTITSDVICETTDSNVTCKTMANVLPSIDFGEVFAIFKNYNNYPVNIHSICVYYDKYGNKLATKSGIVIYLGYLESGIDHFDAPSIPEDNKTPTYAKYKITYSVEPSNNDYATYTSCNNKIKVLSTVEGEDNLSLEVKNTSGKTLQENPFISVLFYDENDQLIGYRSSAQPEIKEPGTIGYFNALYPYNYVEHEHVKPARFEFYPESAYTVKYK